jgi:arsenate reductase
MLPTMEAVTLYHNPRCSKSRAALALLTERGVDVSVVRYLDAPLSAARLADLGERLGLPISAWVRTGEQAYADAGLDAESSTGAILAAMERAPILMERPIAVRNRRAVIGRPPERVLELL